jgi:NAD(P)-dependent dehydrogenase (short-subunit alcohol dehydrogenase family)
MASVGNARAPQRQPLMRVVLAVVLCSIVVPDVQAMRVAVFGGSGFIGSRVCQELVSAGADVTSVSKSGRRPEWAADESWATQVRWVAADVTVDGAAAEALGDGVDGVVSCIGKGDLLYASNQGWSGWAWTEFSRDLYAANALSNKQVVAAAKAAGAQRFVYVGVGSECEMGFGGPNPGLYMGKRDAALAARDAFGDTFTYFGPHVVVERNDDLRIKTANSVVARGLNSINDFLGDIRSFGPDYTTKTRLAVPVPVDRLAVGIAACVCGRVEVEETVREAGMTTYSEVREKEQQNTQDLLRHVDGTAAICELAARAEAGGGA